MSEQNHSENRMTIWVSNDLREQSNTYIDFQTSSYSEFARQALQQRILLQQELERRGVEMPDEWPDQERLLSDIIRRGIDARQDQ